VIELMHTKIAGTTSGPDADMRQDILRYVQRHPEMDWQLGLWEEPDNPYDKDAIQVIIYSPKGNPVHIGYIPNSDTICRECGTVFARFPHSGSCSECGFSGKLERYGTATKLSQLIRDGVKLKAEIAEVTGGGEKSYGCNLRVCREA
jgi:ribosomal protein L37E